MKPISRETARAACRLAASRIRAEHDSLHLNHWATHRDRLDHPEDDYEAWSVSTVADMAAPSCNTPACVAGHLASAYLELVGPLGTDMSIPVLARTIVTATGYLHARPSEVLDAATGAHAPYDLFGALPSMWPNHYLDTTDFDDHDPSWVAETAATILDDLATGTATGFITIS